MRHLSWTAIIVCTLLCHGTVISVSGTACPACVKSLVVFGDSLSDTGLPNGLWSKNNQTVPPNRLGYNNGRFTNERVWSEIVSQSLALQLLSFAVGGATVNNVSRASTTLRQEVDAYQAFAANNVVLKPSAAVILAGANDLLGLSSQDAANLSKAVEYLDNIPNGIEALATSLLAAGNTSVIIANIPAIEIAPYAANLSHTPEIKLAVAYINRGIGRAVVSLQQSAPTGSKVILWDLHKLSQEVVSNPYKYGLKNVTAPCLVTNATRDNPTNPEVDVVSVCQNPDQYLFWDPVHPASGGMYVMARNFFYLMRKNRLV